MDKLLLTPAEAANALSIGRSKLYELMATGQIASIRFGSCRRIPTGALHQFIESLDDRGPSTVPELWPTSADRSPPPARSKRVGPHVDGTETDRLRSASPR